MTNIVFIDNKDSFTYNLVDEFMKLGHAVTVYRNSVSDNIIHNQIDQLLANNEDALIVYSPGPGKPSDVPLLSNLLDRYSDQVPVLGICLGHQAIAEYFGGKITIADETVHGKSSEITIEDHPIFDGFGSALTIARYHSLIATELPETIEVIGQYKDMPMAILHKEKRILGFQFHPESILTISGSKLIEQSINYLTNKSDV